MTVVVLDIDGVLAKTGNEYAHYLNTFFELGISDERLEVIQNNQEFVALAEVRAYVRKGPEFLDRFNMIFREAQFLAEIQERKGVIAGAVDGVIKLAEKYTILYATNRREDTAGVTRQWLERAGFPHTDRLHCCNDRGGFVEKFRCALPYLAKPAERVFIVDDMPAEMERGYSQLMKQDARTAWPLVAHTALLAFGHTMLPACPFRIPILMMAACPSWAHVEEAMTDCRPYLGKELTLLERLFEEDCKSTLYRVPKDKIA